MEAFSQLGFPPLTRLSLACVVDIKLTSTAYLSGLSEIPKE